MEARETHGATYDYTFVVYQNANTKIQIVCPHHGSFWQRPNDHLRGFGCSKCGSKRSVQTRRITTKTFVRRAERIHGKQYDYSKVRYVSAHEKVHILCPRHGAFNQTPNTHLNGAGCPVCGTNRSAAATAFTTKEFIRRSRLIHGDRYDYSSTQYVSAHKKVTVTCPKHGIFEQIASKHLQGHGCKLCCRRNHSNKALRWLKNISRRENIYIQHAENGGEYKIPGTRFYVDGFCEATNTVYEFHGDVYHGNPKFDPLAKCHPYEKTQTAKQLYEQTIQREERIKELGYNLVVEWENDPKMLRRYQGG